MDQEQKQQTDLGPEETGALELSGLGALLRGEREKRGLSREEVADKTRLRGHIIEALENEAWDALPQAAFVKGFIRTYAKLLSLDEQKALDLYENAVVAESTFPGALLETKPSRGRRIVTALVLLVAAAGILYFFLIYPAGTRGPLSEPEKVRLETEQEPTTLLPPEPVMREPAKEEPAPVTAPESVALSEEAALPDAGSTQGETPLPQASFAVEEEQSPQAAEGTVTVESGHAPAEWLVLEGDVKQRTWVKIYVDDQAPKEYIFQPGSRPQWKAREGFNLLVGNAAGIEFEFNGRKFENLGKLGQVVRLDFPAGFKATRYEE